LFLFNFMLPLMVNKDEYIYKKDRLK